MDGDGGRRTGRPATALGGVLRAVVATAAATLAATVLLAPAAHAGTPDPDGPRAPGAAALTVDAEPRIVGGSRASTADHPWVVYLVDPSGFQFCGGTLVAPDKVLTAAHCAAATAPERTRVVVGRDDKESTEGDEVAVRSAWVSPDFVSVGRGVDVAVLTLDRDLERTPLPLAGPGDEALYGDGVAAQILGWGATSEGGPAARYLEGAIVPMRADEYCRAGNSSYDPGKLTCAGYDVGTVDTCQGDSGGPLVVAGKLVGITSFGDGCARAGKPGYYVRVAALDGLAAQLRSP